MELTLEQALQKAIQAQQSGEIVEADRLYTAILKSNPQHPHANHNLGVLAVGIGKVSQALPYFKIAIEVDPTMTQFWISYIDTLILLNQLTDAEDALIKAKKNIPQVDTLAKIENKLNSQKAISMSLNSTEPPDLVLQALIKKYSQGQFEQAAAEAESLISQFPNSVNLHNILGVALKRLGMIDKAILSLRTCIAMKPDFAEAYHNLGNALKEKGKLDDAIEAIQKAVNLKPNYPEAFSNLGAILLDKYDLNASVAAFQKALSLNPNYAIAQNNLGNALSELGLLDEAINAYKAALHIQPNLAEAYNNMGNALRAQGKVKEAKLTYESAISIKPNFATAHRNLSIVNEYSHEHKHFNQVMALLNDGALDDGQRCELCFAASKMYDDIGDLQQAFRYLREGNKLRKKLLGYSFRQDQALFDCIKNKNSIFFENALNLDKNTADIIPIFIIGMPRSGTTLVEQIISSHSQINGSGELVYVSEFGSEFLHGSTKVSQNSIQIFRDKYLQRLRLVSNSKRYATDKMPQNFRFTALILAAFPEAKLIHVKRKPEAVCWSNFKTYFVSTDLGYSCDLQDTVAYYNLYNDMMQSWQATYGDRIYHLNYEKLTIDQELETKKLIKYLGVEWEPECLSPHKNKRNVKTASQQQVRSKVYKGSSDNWSEYEIYLNNAFDQLSPL